MSMRVVAPGLLTTVQDSGRIGSRHLGVGQAGALDAYSHSIANLLVGNPTGAATLEITLGGPTLVLEDDAVIALCGATIDAHADGVALADWRPIMLPAGVTVSLGACRQGARAYLAVAGGFSVAAVLASASTDLRGGFGGVGGRALARGDRLACEPAPHTIETISIAPWWIDPSPELQWDRPAVARVIAVTGDAPWKNGLFDRTWRVATASNRQGLRLEGTPLPSVESDDRVSEPVAPGAIQLPSDGQPIVLLADAQTHGGYPRIGHAIRADWPRLAQLRPGDVLHFSPCTEDEARQARLEQAHRLARLALAIADRRRPASPY
ncbi:MAG: allophanate hydrolase subunit 2 family protein [Xanthomonadaceae bacterium]|nr:allophanate hydrolase subunit 2 family protein [Xanthomonadaceae bacterium]